MKKIFKEIEVRMTEQYTNDYIELSSFLKVIRELSVSNLKLDPKTMRVMERLLTAIEFTYKVQKESESVDLNSDITTVILSRKKIKKLILKSLNRAKKEHLDPEEEIEDLEVEETINKQELLELVKSDLKGIVAEILKDSIQKVQTVTQPVKNNRPKKKEVVPNEEDELEKLLNEQEAWKIKVNKRQSYDASF